MIRINLARTSAVTTSQADYGVAAAASALRGGQAHPVAKVFIIVIFPVALYVYERQVLIKFRQQLVAEQVKLNLIKVDVEKFGAVTSAVADVKNERDKLQKRIEVVANISRRRASKILTISELQSVMPEDTWLTELEIDSSLILMKGLSRSPTSVQTLVEKLGKLKFLESASNKGVTREMFGSTSLHKFTINAQFREGI